MKRILGILLAALMALGMAGSASAKESLAVGVDTTTLSLGETLEVSYEVNDKPANSIVMVHINLYSGDMSRTDYDENFTEAKKTIRYTLEDDTVDYLEVEVIVYRLNADHYDLVKTLQVEVDGSSPVPAFEVKLEVPETAKAGEPFNWTITLESGLPVWAEGTYSLKEVRKTGNTSTYYSIGSPVFMEKTLHSGTIYTFQATVPQGYEAVQIWVDLYGVNDTGYGWSENSKTIAVTGNVNPDPGPDTVAAAKVKGFVGRCYALIMDRQADAGGLDFWSGRLLGKEATASEIINDFTKSDEFVNKKLSTAEKVDVLYNTMLNRQADEAGKAYWVALIDGGGSEAQLINGFCGSAEFTAICSDYGITPGSVQEEGQGSGTGIEGFVRRCYSEALGRDADQGGVDYWVGLMSGGMNPRDVAENFVFSEELTGRDLGNDEFIKTMYRLYMGREADEGGLAYWNSLMDGGMSRKEVCEGFASSAEFAEIVDGFNLPYTQPC